MFTVFIVFALVVSAGTLYFAWKSREFRKFLAGAFFVSTGMQAYLYFAKVSVPVLGTDFVQTPGLTGLRAVVHFLLFLVTLYFGFIHKPKGGSVPRRRESAPISHATTTPNTSPTR